MPLSTLTHLLSPQVESAQRDPSGTGRVVESWSDVLVNNQPLTLEGPLAQAGASETMLYAQQQHDVIFAFVVEGTRYPNAKPNDRFVDVSANPVRFYYVRGLDDVSSAGRWTIYYLSERPSGA